MLLVAQAPAPPPIEEITIARIHAAFKDGTLTKLAVKWYGTDLSTPAQTTN